MPRYRIRSYAAKQHKIEKPCRGLYPRAARRFDARPSSRFAAPTEHRPLPVFPARQRISVVWFYRIRSSLKARKTLFLRRADRSRRLPEPSHRPWQMSFGGNGYRSLEAYETDDAM